MTGGPSLLILASASPRRRELLGKAGLQFEVAPAAIDETRRPGETPGALVERLAREKAAHIATRRAGHFVLGADTIVGVGDAVLGKPRDEDHALELLETLAGTTHRVITGVALVTPEGAFLGERVESRVTFHPASRDTLRCYVARGESLDKAGAYALQGAGRSLVSRVEGSESNVIGLPLEETLALLRRGGYFPVGMERP